METRLWHDVKLAGTISPLRQFCDEQNRRAWLLEGRLR